MVLGYSNFFGLDDEQYALKLREYSTHKLQQYEKRRLRAQVAAAWSILSGAGFAYLTMGGSLIICGIGGRKWRVAHRKLGLIRKELMRRKVPLHKMDRNDWLIPLASCAAGTALGAGIGIGVDTIVDFSTLASVGAHNSSAMLEHPSAAIEGFGEGFVAQPDLVIGDGHSDLLNGMLGDTEIHLLDQSNIGNATDIFQEFPSEQLAEFGGAYAGVAAATAIERGVASVLTQELSWWIMEYIEERDVRARVKQKHECTRLFGTPALTCNRCEDKIFFGSYWHCCSNTCGDDDFDLCQSCYEIGHRCWCSVPSLVERQFAWIGNLYYPNKKVLLQRCEQNERPSCEFCSSSIKQGRYFRGHHIIQGREREIDICPWCYTSRMTFNYRNEYELYSFAWARALPNNQDNPYEKFSGKVVCRCERCDKEVKQGIFYHCNLCKGTKGEKSVREGNFDLCQVCYETSGGCNKEEDHVLCRYEAFAYHLTADERKRSSTYCDILGCRRSLSTETYWYQCSECQVADDAVFTVCQVCYSSGIAHCQGKTHSMTRCRWPDETDRVVKKRGSWMNFKWP